MGRTKKYVSIFFLTPDQDPVDLKVSKSKPLEKAPESVFRLDFTRIKLAMALGFIKQGRKYKMSGAEY